MEEEYLITGIKSGDNGMIGKFYAIYENLFYTVAKQYLYPYGTERDIEDCVQYTFSLVWKDIDKYDSQQGSFKNWCLMLLKRRAINEHKRMIREWEYKRKEETVDGKKYVDVEQEVMDKDIILTVTEIINHWDFPKNEIARMRYLEQEKPEDIAKLLGIPIRQVYYYLCESKKALQKQLWQRGFVDKI